MQCTVGQPACNQFHQVQGENSFNEGTQLTGPWVPVDDVSSVSFGGAGLSGVRCSQQRSMSGLDWIISAWQLFARAKHSTPAAIRPRLVALAMSIFSLIRSGLAT